MSKIQKKSNDHIQVRIDRETKKKAQKILENIGLDISSAVKILFKQIVNTGNLPLETRDINGFTLRKSLELKEAILEAESGKKSFSSSDKLIKELLS